MKILPSDGEAETATGRELERTTLRNDEPILGGNNIGHRFTIHIYIGPVPTIIEVTTASYTNKIKMSLSTVNCQVGYDWFASPTAHRFIHRRF